MKILVLMSAVISGLCTFSSCLPRQYHFVNEHKTWSEAQSYCREKYTDLATIDNMEDMNQLVQIADRNNITSSNRTVWIGLYSNMCEWKWSLASWFYGAGKTEFRNWHPPQSDCYNGNEFCVQIKVDRVCNDFPCNASFPFICNQGEILVYINKFANRTEAQNYCRKYYTDLAWLRNKTENQFIVNLMIPYGMNVWIGLYRERWIQSDGSNYSFTYWNQTNPDNLKGFCTGLSLDSACRWTNWNCNDTLPFYCYSVVPLHRQVVRVKLTRKNSGVDVEDPAVREAILQQIKMKLRENQPTKEFSLSWRQQRDGKVFQKEGNQFKLREFHNWKVVL